MRILTRYILREVTSHALLGGALFTFVLLMRDLGHILSAALLYIAYKSYIPLPAAPVVFAPVIVGASMSRLERRACGHCPARRRSSDHDAGVCDRRPSGRSGTARRWRPLGRSPRSAIPLAQPACPDRDTEEGSAE